MMLRFLFGGDERWRPPLAGFCAASGLALLGWAILLYRAYLNPRGPFGRWVASWYENEVFHRNRKGQTWTSWQGSDAIQHSVIFGALLVIAAVAIYFRIPYKWRRDS